MADGGVEGHIERGNGLKVSALIPGLRVPDSNTGQVNVLYSWVIHLTFTVPLSSQEYSTGKLSGKPDKMLGGGGVTLDGLAFHPGRSGNTPSHFMLHGNQDKV